MENADEEKEICWIIKITISRELFFLDLLIFMCEKTNYNLISLKNIRWNRKICLQGSTSQFNFQICTQSCDIKDSFAHFSTFISAPFHRFVMKNLIRDNDKRLRCEWRREENYKRRKTFTWRRREKLIKRLIYWYFVHTSNIINFSSKQWIKWWSYQDYEMISSE